MFASQERETRWIKQSDRYLFYSLTKYYLNNKPLYYFTIFSFLFLIPSSSLVFIYSLSIIIDPITGIPTPIPMFFIFIIIYIIIFIDTVGIYRNSPIFIKDILDRIETLGTQNPRSARLEMDLLVKALNRLFDLEYGYNGKLLLKKQFEKDYDGPAIDLEDLLASIHHNVMVELYESKTQNDFVAGTYHSLTDLFDTIDRNDNKYLINYLVDLSTKLPFVISYEMMYSPCCYNRNVRQMLMDEKWSLISVVASIVLFVAGALLGL